MKLHDTIAAIATPKGSGGIAIIRLSGNDAVAIASKMVYPYGNKELSSLESHKLTLCRISSPESPSAILDEALVAVMYAPKSYTGETVVEINCHGGFLVADKILTKLLSCGARLAEAGEFTRRAFINGKTDLSGAEAVMDLMNSGSEAGLNNAAKILTGGLAKKIADFRSSVMELASHVSAAADFPDEVDPMESHLLIQRFDDLQGELTALLGTFDTGRIIRDGVRTAIVGKPNVGKSSVLNALLRWDRAIVTDVPGTTRDTIEELATVGGITLRLIDTAGIRSAADEVEKIGIQRSMENIDLADLCLFVVDSSQEISREDCEIGKALQNKKVILIINKTDKTSALGEASPEAILKICPSATIYTATPKGSAPMGIDNLEAVISRMFQVGDIKEDQIYLANERQRDSLLRATSALENAKHALVSGMPFDLLFIDLEDTLSALGEVTGETVQEEIVDKVFENFCVGK
ncbi:MAG: tRNA uridine-5-carboxymethylaminomethyl(34) synthesis GTPase MnmE [Clostridia bacterium]|nr:tRNA uridine-5-carboxymethylaminomethyl(34) synthesis GTPase MnmE [Clostridia bacterium]